MYLFFLKDIPTAFSPLGGPMCPHKKKKKKTEDLRKLGNFKEIPEMLGFDGEYTTVHPKAKFNVIW